MRLSAALLLTATVAGCAQPQPIVLQPPPGPPPGVDGRYRGTARLVRSESRFCPRSGPRVYELDRGTVTLAYSAPPARSGGNPPRVTLSAPIGQDGRVQTSDGVGTMDGQLRDGLLEVTIASQVCEHRWTLRKVP